MVDPSEDGERVEEPKEQPPAVVPTPPSQPITMSREELENLQKELKEFKDKYIRTLAEMENARKRMVKEREENAQHAMASVIVEFLRPLDNLENALAFTEKMSQDVKNWAIGFQMILSQFKDILAAHGVTPVASEGRPFDPHLHEAVESIESTSHKPGTVIEECSRGYKMGNRTIRPARVKVAKAKKSEKSEKTPPAEEAGEEQNNS